MDDWDKQADTTHERLSNESRSSVGDGNFVVPPLRREPSQGTYGSCVNRSGSVGEDEGMIGEVVERELVLVISVRSGKERDMTRG